MTLSLQVPLDFSIRVLDLNWCDLFYGVQHGVFGWSDIKDYAFYQMGQQDSLTSELEAEISMLGKDEAAMIVELARQASEFDVANQSLAKSRIRFLLLRWELENFSVTNRGSLDQLERLYADFGYPDDLRPIVGYLPPGDDWEPENHSPKENAMRIQWHLKSLLTKSPFVRSSDPILSV